ncbi:cell division protein FtsQ/DivIB [Gracilinema caldarium]|uniref:Polypeptide-transport-associated domain protein FtsQ-type n=1 Tax=Gracilinema caldarium (strain ATCC 51460 / DSM 7334 / H1) TaxID=744872 RepID=F8F1X9_GRAC1|nr:FtsQ-type POTRA domain-containing protein [Gracilinema caldarium]AEJ19826.1 Polypeptide-transport-associated domain protein FtsQ-type [Gracilinema caldarium DSM 7334]
MSDGFLFLDDYVTLESETRSQSQKEVVLKRVTLIFALLLGMELIYQFCIVPCLPLNEVRITTIQGYSRDALLRIAGIDESMSYITLNSDKVSQSLSSIPLVESVAITKHFPNSVDIVLKERTAVAISLAKVSDKLVPIYIDREGVVFKIGGAHHGALPLISGLVFDQVVPGMKLPVHLKNFFASLEMVEKTNPALLQTISEVRLQQKAYGGYELIVYPSNYMGRVRLGSELNEDVLRYMMLVLDVLASRGIQTDEIDFRTGTISYRTKEASSG